MKIGFYGLGHMASALVEGFLKKELCTPTEISILAKSDETKVRARAQGFFVCDSAQELFERTDAVILALKPAVFKELRPAMSALDTEGKRVISIMASVSLKELQETFSCPVLRVMPTVAVATGHDIIGMTVPNEFEDFKFLFEKLGIVHILDEEHLDRLTVAASCGPGFAAKVLKSYEQACIKLGFNKEQAVAITAAVFSFAARAQGADPFATLQRQVATPGGVTETGNAAMGSAVEDAFDAAFKAALQKARPCPKP